MISRHSALQATGLFVEPVDPSVVLLVCANTGSMIGLLVATSPEIVITRPDKPGLRSSLKEEESHC